MPSIYLFLRNMLCVLNNSFSNGSGRSGLFCGCYNIIERIRSEGTINIMQTVKCLQMNRPQLISGLVGAV